MEQAREFSHTYFSRAVGIEDVMEKMPPFRRRERGVRAGV
jgi:hypothetical protein